MSMLHKAIWPTRRKVTPNFPELLIIGVQKGGTTTLFNWLSHISGFCAAKEKEVGFFSKSEFYSKGYEWYRSKFHHCEAPVIHFEATPMYFYCRNAAGRIHSFNPEVKLIVIFRDPAERCYSAWNMFKRFNAHNPDEIYDNFVRHADPPQREAIAELLFTDKFPSFQQAVLDDIDRYTSDSLLEEPSFFRRGMYHEQLMRYLDYFELDDFLFLEQEDLNSQPFLTQSIASFLEINISLEDKNIGKVIDKNISPFKEITKEESEVIDYLRFFYKPYNEALYNLISRRFNW
jgi:hypothetical protein